MAIEDYNTTASAGQMVFPNPDALLANDHPGIEYQTYNYGEGIIFSEEIRLMVVVRGTLILTYGKLKYRVHKNQMVFLKKNTLIEFRSKDAVLEKYPIEIIFFNLTYGLIKEFSMLADLAPIVKHNSPEILINKLNNNMQKFIKSIVGYQNEPSMSDKTLMKIKLFELLFSLKWHDAKMLDCILAFRRDYRPNIAAIIEENLMTPVSISQLARLTGRSVSSFRRDFLATYNMVPSRWIRERKLKKAKELLLITNMTVTDICFTLGFENIAHFSRVFKAYFGYSPSKFRIR